MKKVELLYFDGCPSWKEGLGNLENALAQENLATKIDLILIENEADAQREKFLGSPSFRIDGKDLWFEERDSYSLGCRIYATKEGYKGIPTVAMLRNKIRDLQ